MEQTIKYKGYSIEVIQDTDPESPRQWDPPSTMVTWHKRYNLGDEQPKEGHDEWLEQMAKIDTEIENYEFSIEDCIRMIEEQGTIILPLYLYSHSGITISTSPFSCKWDSGQIGYIYITKESMEKEGWDPEHAEKWLQGEVETYDEWLRNEVYGYQLVNNEGEEMDSCWGYYGDPETSGLLADAKSAIDHAIRRNIKQHLQKVKEWIINKVPLQYRKPMAI